MLRVIETGYRSKKKMSKCVNFFFSSFFESTKCNIKSSNHFCIQIEILIKIKAEPDLEKSKRPLGLH